MHHRSSVSPLWTKKVQICSHDYSENRWDKDTSISDDLTSQTDFHIKSEVHRELRTLFNLSRSELPKVKQSQLDKLLFYRLVQGGNIDIVSSVLSEIRKVDQTSLDYLISGKQASDAFSQCDKQNKSASCVFILVSLMLYCFLMVPLFIITTPIFYSIHGFFICLYRNKKISKFSRFPLMFAALSDSKSMLQLFAEHRPGILCDTDDEGNNIFHYLAEVSSKNPDRAIQCFKIILQTFPTSLIREVLLEGKNLNGFTALEHSILNGSPLYFTLVLESDGILKSTALVISERSVFSKRPTTTIECFEGAADMLQQIGQPFNYDEIKKSNSTSDRAPYTLFHYDVTKYERGDVFGDNSFLLTLLTRRDLAVMSDAEVRAIATSPLLTQWMSIKSKSLTTIRNLQFSVSNILVQILGVYATTISESDSIERLVISFWKTVEELATANSTGNNGSPAIISNKTGVATVVYDSFIPSALEALNTACGFDISLHLPNSNATSFQMADTSLFYVWMIAGFLSFVSAVTILSDLYLRLVFLWRNYFSCGWATQRLKYSVMIRRVFARPMQVSYIARQLSLSSAIFWILMLYCSMRSRGIAAVDVASANEKANLRTAAMMLAVACMTTRFLSLLYCLRAKTKLNVAGRFVMTMCKMFSFIIEFSWIYFCISAFFSALFMFVVYDPMCAYNSYYPFDSWWNSMMGVFRLMLSDNMLPDRLTLEAAFTYFIYINLTTVVVLSLVTGISGGIADRVLSENVTHILESVEALENSVEMEATEYIFTPLFRYLHVRRLKNERRMITAIDKDSNVLKVIIEIEGLRTRAIAQNSEE